MLLAPESTGAGPSLTQRTRRAGCCFPCSGSFHPHSNLHHYRFLASGVPDIEEGLSKRNVGLVLRTRPDHSLTKFCEQVRPAMVIGDENPLREAEHWRLRSTQQLRRRRIVVG